MAPEVRRPPSDEVRLRHTPRSCVTVCRPCMCMYIYTHTHTLSLSLMHRHLHWIHYYSTVRFFLSSSILLVGKSSPRCTRLTYKAASTLAGGVRSLSLLLSVISPAAGRRRRLLRHTQLLRHRRRRRLSSTSRPVHIVRPPPSFLLLLVHTIHIHIPI